MPPVHPTYSPPHLPSPNVYKPLQTDTEGMSPPQDNGAKYTVNSELQVIHAYQLSHSATIHSYDVVKITTLRPILIFMNFTVSHGNMIMLPNRL